MARLELISDIISLRLVLWLPWPIIWYLHSTEKHFSLSVVPEQGKAITLSWVLLVQPSLCSPEASVCVSLLVWWRRRGGCWGWRVRRRARGGHRSPGTSRNNWSRHLWNTRPRERTAQHILEILQRKLFRELFAFRKHLTSHWYDPSFRCFFVHSKGNERE